jgi:serine/threonine-protein kinase
MAAVYEARHVHLGTRVAIKRMHPSSMHASTLETRFRNEAFAAACIRHPNVVRIHDYDIDDTGVPYLVMELLDGAPLSSTIASEGPLSPHCTVDLFLKLLSGVAAIHAAGFVHRDLKPHNVILHRVPGGGLEPVIVDFGIAKRVDAGPVGLEASGLTESGAILGTARYMSPEQIVSAKDVGPAADQYSLAVMMYECLAGRHPFSGSGSYDLVQDVLHARVHSIGEFCSGIPPEMDDVVLRAMSRNPSERFPSVHALGEALVPFAGDAAAMFWRADVHEARGGGAEGAPGQTRSEVRVPGLEVRARAPFRVARLWAAAGVVAAGVLVAGGTVPWTKPIRGASADSRPAAASAEPGVFNGAPAPGPESTGSTNPSAAASGGTSASSTAAAPKPSASPGGAGALRRPETIPRVTFGTNRAPILE